MLHIAPTQQRIGLQAEHKIGKNLKKTSQELRMLSSVTINCQVTKIVVNLGSQLSAL